MTGLSTPTQPQRLRFPLVRIYCFHRHFAQQAHWAGTRPGICSLFRQLRSCRCFSGRFPHSQLSANPFWRGCALRVIHPRLRPLAGGRAARGSLAASRSYFRHPVSDRVAADIGWRLCCSLADRRNCARLPGRDAPTRHPAGADPVSRSSTAGYVGMVSGDPEQSPKILPLLYCAGDLECGYHHGVVMEGWTRRGVEAGGPDFYRFCHRQRAPICRAGADGDGLSATLESAVHIRHRACADCGAKLFPGVPKPRSGTDQRVCRLVSGQLFAYWRGIGPGLRADPEYAASELVRHGGFCRRAARDVECVGNAGGDRSRIAAAVGAGPAKHRFLRSSFGGGLSRPW